MRIFFQIIAFLTTILLLFPVILIIFFPPAIDRWLSVNEPVDADILIVEGWIPSGADEKVIEEFNKGNYSLLVTTGGPLPAAYNMSHDGTIRFDLFSAGLQLNKEDTVKVVLYAYGEPASGEYARYTLVHDDDTIGRAYTTSAMTAYTHYFPVGNNPAGMLDLIFDNDLVTDSEDRNLHVWKIEMAGITIPVRSEHTWLFRGNDTVRGRPLNQKSFAEEKAYTLASSGIDSHRIVSLEVPGVRRYRTYADAVMTGEWIRYRYDMPTAVNIFSFGNHARRSRLLYRYALPAYVDIGIISGGSSSESSGSRITVFRQFAAYIYSRFFFNYRGHYRRIIENHEG